MAAVDAAIAASLGINTGTREKEKRVVEKSDTEDVISAEMMQEAAEVRAEAKIYKELYEKLLEKMMK